MNSCKVALENGAMSLLPQYAKIDIVCYKLIKRKHDGTPTSIYGHGDYREIKEETVLLPAPKIVKNNIFKRLFLGMPKFTVTNEGITWNEENQWFDITFGFIHTLAHSFAGEMKSHMMIDDTPGHYELWECVIPQGTRYYQANRRGSHYEYSDSYASKEIVFVKKIDEIDYKGWFNE